MVRRAAGVAAALLVGLALAACGGSGDVRSGQSAGGRMKGMAGMNMGGMNMPGVRSSPIASEVPEVNGVKPVASQTIASADWQGMTIQARTMTPVPFLIFTGTRERMVRPPKGTSFHLMVMLNDQHTGVAIPYASVWATILNRAGKVVYDEQQLPMISAYMGPHYGNNVALPTAGRYTLKLLISPPVSARHLEYQHVWLRPHTVKVGFTWNPPTPAH